MTINIPNAALENVAKIKCLGTTTNQNILVKKLKRTDYIHEILVTIHFTIFTTDIH
jgi:hypothetical protein